MTEYNKAVEEEILANKKELSPATISAMDACGVGAYYAKLTSKDTPKSTSPQQKKS